MDNLFRILKALFHAKFELKTIISLNHARSQIYIADRASSFLSNGCKIKKTRDFLQFTPKRYALI